MPRYDYKIAVATLSETEKNRFLACYFSMSEPNGSTDWDFATTSFGAASSDSMRVMVRQALKKIKDAGGLEGTPAATNNETGGAAATPKKRGRKTKDVDGNDTEKPAPKKGRGKKKALKAELVYDEDEAVVGDLGETITAKTEDSSE